MPESQSIADESDMGMNIGITGKLLAWFSLFVVIFYGTILILYLNIQQIVGVSEGIINKNYEIAIISKKMIENLSPCILM